MRALSGEAEEEQQHPYNTTILKCYNTYSTTILTSVGACRDYKMAIKNTCWSCPGGAGAEQKRGCIECNSIAYLEASYDTIFYYDTTIFYDTTFYYDTI